MSRVALCISALAVLTLSVPAHAGFGIGNPKLVNISHPPGALSTSLVGNPGTVKVGPGMSR